jgi:hypothetical protein
MRVTYGDLLQDAAGGAGGQRQDQGAVQARLPEQAAEHVEGVVFDLSPP